MPRRQRLSLSCRSLPRAIAAKPPVIPAPPPLPPHLRGDGGRHPQAHASPRAPPVRLLYLLVRLDPSLQGRCLVLASSSCFSQAAIGCDGIGGVRKRDNCPCRLGELDAIYLDAPVGKRTWRNRRVPPHRLHDSSFVPLVSHELWPSPWSAPFLICARLGSGVLKLVLST